MNVWICVVCGWVCDEASGLPGCRSAYNLPWCQCGTASNAPAVPLTG